MTDSRAELARAIDLAELELAIVETERELDITERRLPPDATRGLYPHERAAETRFAELDEAVDTTTDRIGRHTTAYRRRYTDELTRLLDEAAKASPLPDVARRNLLDQLAAIDDPSRVGPNSVAAKLAERDALTAIADELDAHRAAAARRLAQEAQAQGLRVATLTLPDNRAESEAAARRLLRTSTSSIDAAASRVPYLHPVYELNPADVQALVVDATEAAHDTGEKARAVDVRSVVSRTENEARADLARRLVQPKTIYASELLDRNTCTPCSHVDGHEYATLDEALADYPLGRYRECAGGDRCRGTLVYVWPTEADPTLLEPGDRRPPKPPPPGRPVPKTGPPAPPVVPGALGITKLPRKAPVELPPAQEANRAGIELYGDVKDTNPGYGTAPRFGVNCVHVVNAHELRRRGYDVTATPLPEGFPMSGRSSLDAYRRWRRADGTKPLPELMAGSPAQAKRLAEAWPVGARGWIRLTWQRTFGGGGHIYNVERTPEGLRWLDAQTGEVDVDYDRRMRKASRGTVSLMRVDDLTPTDEVLEFVQERGGPR